MVRPLLDGGHKLHVAGLAALAFILIALLGAVASYIDNYFTESVGQWVAHDLRMRTYHHLQRLSLGYYDTHQTGTLLSTITTDIETIQDFASSSTLDILIDLLTIVVDAGPDVLAELGLHPDRRRCDAVSALLHFAFQKSREEGDAPGAEGESRNRRRRAAGAGVDAGYRGLRTAGPGAGSAGRRQPRHGECRVNARKVKSLLSPIVTITVAFCTAIVLWRGSALILRDVMTVGALTVYLSYLTKFFKPVKDLATTTNAIAQAAVGVERVRAILETDTILPGSAKTPSNPDSSRAKSNSSTWPSATTLTRPC